MTGAETLGIRQAAARAALAVPGVARLQPSLAQRLADAATRMRPSNRSPADAAAGGIRAERAQAGGGWTVEVRCVLHGDRRALDVAAAVHDRVHAAVTSHATRYDVPGPVEVRVTVTAVDNWARG